MTGLRRRIVHGWIRFWFEPCPPSRLGIARIVFASVLFGHYLDVDFSHWGDVSHAFWFPGVLVAHVDVPVAPPHVLFALAIVWKASLALVALGCFTRTAAVSAALIGLYLLGLRNSFVEIIYHEDATCVFGLVILAASRCGDAWSIDSLRRGTTYQAHAEYSWPGRLIQCLLSCIFLSAGVSKLRHTGLQWPADVFPTYQMAGHYGLNHNSPVLTWGTLLYRVKWLGTLVGAGALLTELCYPLALVSCRARWVVVPAAVTMLVAIRLLMGPCFIVVIAAHAFWVPWSRYLRSETLSR